MSVEQRFLYDQVPELKFSEIDELNTGATKASNVRSKPSEDADRPKGASDGGNREW